MDWFPHAIKANAVTESPSSWLAFHCATDTRPVGRAGHITEHRLSVGVAVHLRIEDGQETRRREYIFHSPYGFWRTVCACLSRHRPLWIVAHDLLWHWRLVGGFAVVERNDPKMWRVVLGDRVKIIRGKLGGNSLCAVDAMNYYSQTVQQLVDAFGEIKPQYPGPEATPQKTYLWCHVVADACLTAITGLAKQRRQHDLGTWGSTAAQLAWRTWRHLPHGLPVYPHRHPDALGLERGCCYGGRLTIRRLGKMPGPVYHVDANSLYPAVMRGRLYPRRLERYLHRPTLDYIRRCLDSWCICAKVWLDTPVDHYPVRRLLPLRGEARGGERGDQWPAQSQPGRTYYPVGVFQTYLCGEELRRAVKAGHVLTVESAALYEPGDLFTAYVNRLWPLRQKARGNPALEQCYKVHLASLWGKFQQRSPMQAAAPEVLPPGGDNWAHFWRCRPGEEGLWECQAIAGVVNEEVKGDGSWDSFPAVAAHVTAAGRDYMLGVKEVVGEGHYYYEDTDGLLLDAQGYVALEEAGWIDQTALGKFKLCGRYEDGEVSGPKHYRIGSREVCAGMDAGARLIGPAAFVARRRDQLDACIRARGGSRPHDTDERYGLPSRFTNGLVGDDGSVRPFRLDWQFSERQPEGGLIGASGERGGALGEK